MKFLILIFTLISFPSYAHDDAEWVQRGGYKNEIGQLCCGKKDCFKLNDNDVVETPQGFHILSKKEFVPIPQSIPASPEGYWRCEWGGERKCFFYQPKNF